MADNRIEGSNVRKSELSESRLDDLDAGAVTCGLSSGRVNSLHDLVHVAADQ